MTTHKEYQLTLTNITAQLCQEGLCHRQELLLSIWEAAQRLILNNSAQSNPTLLANSFLAWSSHTNENYHFNLQPTEDTFRECDIKSQVHFLPFRTRTAPPSYRMRSTPSTLSP